MANERELTEIIDVSTPNGPIKMEVRTYGREKVALKGISLDQFVKSLSALATELRNALDKIGPSRAEIEFGVEAEFSSGSLTAVLVKGSTKANLKVTLEWTECRE